jgi:hypothetical protein
MGADQRVLDGDLVLSGTLIIEPLAGEHCCRLE